MKRLLIVALSTLAIGIGVSPVAGAWPGDVRCTTSYYGSAWHTSCSNGSSSVCYSGGSCHYDSPRSRNPYSQIQEGLEALR